MKKRPTMTQKDVIEDGGVTTPEGIAYEESQRALIEKAAAEARAFLAASSVAERTAPEHVSSPKAAKQRDALEDRLARLDDAINVAKSNLEAASKAETLAKEQREKDQATLRAEQGRLEAEAEEVQRELERLEVAALADAVAREQAVAPRPELQDAAAWRELLAADLAPMVDQGVNALVKLRELLAARGPVLDTISKLVADDTMPGPLAQQYEGCATRARELRYRLAQAIANAQRTLDRAAKFTPEYFTDEVSRAAAWLQKDLERLSGVVIRPKAWREGRAGIKVTGPPPAIPGIVVSYTHEIDNLLASYRSVQKLVDAEKNAPNREVIIRLPADPALEQTRRAAMRNALRGPAPAEEPGVLASLGINENEPPRLG